MNTKIDEILTAIHALEESLKKELEYEEEKISSDLAAARKQFKENIFLYLARAPLLYILSAPIIYAGILPALILELFLAVYQSVNFRIYKIAPVQRNNYFVYDRTRLQYLNIVEKLNCLYCSYFNGLLAYTSEIAGRSEQFWCPIRHAKKLLVRHTHYYKFVPYGDGERYRRELPDLRDDLKKEEFTHKIASN